MPDREKVIQELNDSLKNQHCGFIDGIGDVYAVSKETIKNIIVLLKEQEVVKPKKTILRKDCSSPVVGYCCSNCNMPLLNIGVTFNYCPSCGREVRWNEIN